MEVNRKREIIRYLNENNSSPFVRNMIDLCNILVDEARMSNDEARGATFLINQGKIKALKELSESLTKKIPKELKGHMVIDS